MIIRINSTNVRYSEEGEVASVQVHFSGNDDQRTININGYIPLTAEEYNGNEPINALIGIVKQKIVEKL
ncbi:hypothetical protein ACEK07_20845 [Alcanivoracaceae bacterium MT1]